jgi:hypothetical protein
MQEEHQNLRSKVTKKKWEENHGNLARYLIAAVESYGFKVELGSLTNDVIEAKLNGAVHSFDARKIRFQATSGAGAAGLKSAFEVVLTPALPSIGRSGLLSQTIETKVVQVDTDL